MTRILVMIWSALALAGFAQSAAAQQFTMKISSPTINDLSQEWARLFREGVQARAGNKIKVEFYPANQLGQIPATVEGIVMGTIEATVPASGFFVGLESRFQVFDAPGIFKDMQHAQRVFADAEVRKQLATLGNAKGIEPLAIIAHGPLMLVSHKPVRAVSDFRGQKIRVPGAAPLQIEPFKKLGAAPISMPLGEVLSAMQNRTIDGLIASVTVFTAFKYYDVAKGMTGLPGSFLIAPVMANRAFLKSLGPELEAIVREEAFKAQRAAERFGLDDVHKTVEIWKKNGGEEITLPESESKAYLEQVRSVLPGIVNANPAIKADYDLLSAAAKRLEQ